MNESTMTHGDAPQMAVVARLAPMVGWVLPGAGLLALIFIYFSAEHPLVRQHSLSELVCSLLMYAIATLGGVFTFVTFGLGAFVVIPILLAIACIALPFWVFAIMAASRGETYEYPWLRLFGMG